MLVTRERLVAKRWFVNVPVNITTAAMLSYDEQMRDIVIARSVSDEAIPSLITLWMAEPVIGRAFARPVGSR